MPELIQNNIFLTVSELVDNNIVADSTIKIGLLRQRQGNSKTWVHKRFSLINGEYVEQPLISRKGNIFVDYESLKDTYKELVKTKLCNGLDPYLYIENKKKQARKKELESFKQSLTDFLEIELADVNYFAELEQYSPADCQRLARGAAWLRLLNSIDTKSAHAKGYKSVQDVRSDALEIINQELESGLVRFKGKKLNNLHVLWRYMNAFKKQECKSLVNLRSGNNNAQKITPVISAWLIDEMSKPTKPSREDVAEAYNNIAESKGWPKVTTSAIKQHLNKPEIVKVWHYPRHGKHVSDDLLQSFIQRRKPSFADAVWDLDGTALQLYYQDDQGKKLKSDLYIYYVVDEYSQAVIGYSIGFTETSELVTEALRMAIQKHGYKPYQLRYDNSSANISSAVSSLMTNMSRVHFPCKPYKGRSKLIETLIGHFEQRVLRKLVNFKGASPTAQGLDSKANPDLLKEIKNDLPTQNQAIEQLNQAVIDWNNRGKERNKYGQMQGETKIQHYAHPHEKRVKLNYFEKMTLFMIERKNNQDKDGKYTYKNQGIKLELFGKTYNYIVPDPDGVGDFIFQQTNYGKKFTVRVNPENPSFALLYDNDKLIAEAFEKEKYAACVADLQEGEAQKIQLYQVKQELYGETYSKSELERQRELLEGVKATGTDGFSWSDTPKTNWNRTESKQVDELNGVAEESDLVKRLKTIGS